jgi:8-oxo-dGTP diphosphatase
MTGKGQPAANSVQGRDPRSSTDSQPVTPSLVSVGWVQVRRRRLLGVRTVGRERFYLPGGKPEAGETLEEALGRELREELGLSLRNIRPLFTIEAPADGLVPPTALTMHCFGGDVSGRPQPGREIAELAWLTASDKRAAPAVADVLSRLRAARLVD